MNKGFLSPLEEWREVGVLETALPEHLGKVLRSLETPPNIGMPFEGLEELFIASPKALLESFGVDREEHCLFSYAIF